MTLDFFKEIFYVFNVNLEAYQKSIVQVLEEKDYNYEFVAIDYLTCSLGVTII
jgi:hypothetical protein